MNSLKNHRNLENAINRLAQYLDIYGDLLQESCAEYPLVAILKILKEIEL